MRNRLKNASRVGDSRIEGSYLGQPNELATEPDQVVAAKDLELVTKTSIGLTCGLVLLAWLVTACGPGQSIAGKWRAEGPGSLLFEFSNDGAVELLDGSRRYPVFHYKILDEDSLQLYDGLGRIQAYDFRIAGDTMTFYDDMGTGTGVTIYRRED